MGSVLSRWLRLDDHERRILVVAGAAAGTGAIFRTPLGAALFSVEVLYRDDFESDAIVPSILASVTGYSIFTTIFGQGHLFATEAQYTVNVLGRLTDVEQFEEIIVKTGEGGRITRLKDIARIELGGKNYNIKSQLNAAPSAPLLIYQLPGANALDLAKQVRTTMKELSQAFPEGMTYKIPYDTTIFVEESIKEVYITLLQAAALVFLVLFIFSIL